MALLGRDGAGVRTEIVHDEIVRAGAVRTIREAETSISPGWPHRSTEPPGERAPSSGPRPVLTAGLFAGWLDDARMRRPQPCRMRSQFRAVSEDALGPALDRGR